MQLIPVRETRAAKSLEAAKELFEVVGKRRELEKTEKELKAYFKKLMPEGGTIRAGRYTVNAAPQTKRTLVRELVKKILGEEKTKECERETPYLEVNVTLEQPSIH